MQIDFELDKFNIVGILEGDIYGITIYDGNGKNKRNIHHRGVQTTYGR